MQGSRKRQASARGFTLVELLVSMAILAVIMLLVTQMIGATSKVWSKTSAKIDSFRQARLGFELLTTELKQATTNTYWDYFNAQGLTVGQYNATGNSAPFSPAAYGRQSELHFISGPEATTNIPYGTASTIPTAHGVFFTWEGGYSSTSTYSSLNSLLNGTGFCIEFGGDTAGATAYFSNGPPLAVLGTTRTPLYRYRLEQFVEPSDKSLFYNYSLTSGTNYYDWYAAYHPGLTLADLPGHAATVRIVANNIIALVIWPKKINTITDTDPNVPGDTALAPNYSYDSRGGVKSGTPPWIPVNGSGTFVPQPLNLNQMPPILQVAMVALDEPSAAILQGSSSAQVAGTAAKPTIQYLFSSAVTNPATGKQLFTVAAPPPTGATMSNMDSDLAYLQTQLAAMPSHPAFQVYETTIAIRGAKFSNP